MRQQISALPAVMNNNTEKTIINYTNKVAESSDWTPELKKNVPEAMSKKFGKYLDVKRKLEFARTVLNGLRYNFLLTYFSEGMAFEYFFN